MTPALVKRELITFTEFTEQKPEHSFHELHDGMIIEMPQPVGTHEEVSGFLATELVLQYKRLRLPYFISGQAYIKVPNAESAYAPDVLLLNRSNLGHEPLWQKFSTVSQGASIPLAIEVVSTNWRVDYLTKVRDYEEIGIPEYWIVDYLGIGGRRFTGNPKQPTLLIHELIDGEYQVSQFRDGDKIQSPSFPELDLRASQIFRGAY